MPRGYFGIGIENTKTKQNIGTLWRSAHLLGASFIFTVGTRYKKQKGDTTKAWRSIPLYHYDTFEQLRAGMPYDCPLVGVELAPGATPLEAFDHPERCVYILGAEDYGLSQAAFGACQHIVVLPGPFSMNVAVAGSIVMYDRHSKIKK